MSPTTRLIYGWAANLLAIFVADAFGLIAVQGVAGYVLGALALGVINILIRPIVTVLSLPAIILTFGLFIFVVNALMLWLTSIVVPNFNVLGFWHTIGAAVVMGLTNFVLHTFLRDVTKDQWQKR